MIGHIEFNASYQYALGYCLQDKKISHGEGQTETACKDRAEVLYYNQCFGNRKELIRQFEDVRKLNFNIAKPVLQLTLSVAPEDAVSKSQFVELSRECARALDFENHQYVTILHKDTDNAHVHIVVNRIGFDRHTVVNQYMLRRVNSFCREAEQQHHLTQTPAIRWYRSQEERNAPTQDQRVIRLGEVIGKTLEHACNYAAFAKEMTEEGYRLYKTERGIAFKDADRVVIRGYETGYPWKTIEVTLGQNEARRLELVRQRELVLKEELALKQELELKQELALKQEEERRQELIQRQEKEEHRHRHGYRHHF